MIAQFEPETRKGVPAQAILWHRVAPRRAEIYGPSIGPSNGHVKKLISTLLLSLFG